MILEKNILYANYIMLFLHLFASVHIYRGKRESLKKGKIGKENEKSNKH